MLAHVLVFFGMVLADVAWTLYFIETGRGKALAAGFWSAAIVAISAFLTVSYVHDRMLVVPAVLGAFAGTAATVWWKNRK